MITQYCTCLQLDYGGIFFFFQAEDGIRDYKVTGVQTCALPISRLRRHRMNAPIRQNSEDRPGRRVDRSEEHTSELQSPCNLVCRLLLEKKKKRHHCPRPTQRQPFALAHCRPPAPCTPPPRDATA